jgi:UDP-N-acetyl-D-mannosaminuronate dehydrogenase
VIKINIIIIGYGEIGLSIGNIIRKKHKLYIYDKKISEEQPIPKEKIDTMHICIPYFDDFVGEIARYVNLYNPELTIIESTIPPGTTQKIYEQTQKNIVHSPVVGNHPNLTKSIKTFTKFVGPTSETSGKLAVEYYNSLGIKAELFTNSTETELAKILCTTTYGVYIAWATEIYNLCNYLNVNFDNVYRKWTNNYNEGYKKLKMPHVKRPVLKPCINGFSGHCVHENAILLYKFLLGKNKKNNFVEEILKIGKCQNGK